MVHLCMSVWMSFPSMTWIFKVNRRKEKTFECFSINNHYFQVIHYTPSTTAIFRFQSGQLSTQATFVHPVFYGHCVIQGVLLSFNSMLGSIQQEQNIDFVDKHNLTSSHWVTPYFDWRQLTQSAIQSCRKISMSDGNWCIWTCPFLILFETVPWDEGSILDLQLFKLPSWLILVLYHHFHFENSYKMSFF